MADFAPPPGPPPPKVPEGWKAVWNAQYSEWFYVNIYTKQSQWEKPTSPVYPPGEAPPDGPPPYAGGPQTPSTTDTKSLGSNNPYGSGSGKSPQPDISEDEKLARRLQEEEEARARGDHSAGTRGAADDFYQQPQQNAYAGAPSYAQQPSPQPGYGGMADPASNTRSKKGLFSSLLGGKSSKPTYQQQGYPSPQPGYGQQPYGQPYGQPAGGYYGGYPQQGGGMMGGAGGRKKPGMGTAGAAALGVGGGLLAGGLIGEALADAGDHGGDYGGDGGDFGGDGGDFGGDGGDFGGDGGDF